MKKEKIIIILLLVSLSQVCFSDSVTKYVECFCSIMELIADPEKYNGKIITAKGVVGFINEKPMIYLTAEHARLGITENSIQIEIEALTKESYGALKKYEGTYVEIHGKFQNRSFAVVSEVKKVSARK